MKNNLSTTLDVESIRRDFPILSRSLHGERSLIYLDNAASSQRPSSVLQSMTDSYEQTYANVHRGVHWLSEQSSEQYEHARIVLGQMLGSRHHCELIFTGGTTASINLVAHAWGEKYLGADDKIVLTVLEHHSNIVPWQQLADRKGAKVEFVGLDGQGRVDLEAFEQVLDERTRMVAVTAMSNVVGDVVPVNEMVRMARDVGAHVLIDAAQHVPHAPTDVKAWGADFVAFSGHKMLGPTGIGCLWGREELLESMPPFLGGGSMISQVTLEGFKPGELPAKFEAGTPPIVEAIGLAVAAEYLQRIGFQKIGDHSKELAALAQQELSVIDGLQILGADEPDSSGIVSFVIDGLSNQDIAIFLDRQGVAIRAGHHCAMPLHEYFQIPNSCRASFYLYNTAQEVKQFVAALEQVVAKLR